MNDASTTNPESNQPAEKCLEIFFPSVELPAMFVPFADRTPLDCTDCCTDASFGAIRATHTQSPALHSSHSTTETTTRTHRPSPSAASLSASASSHGRLLRGRFRRYRTGAGGRDCGGEKHIQTDERCFSPVASAHSGPALCTDPPRLASLRRYSNACLACVCIRPWRQRARYPLATTTASCRPATHPERPN